MDALAWLLGLESWRDAIRVAHKYVGNGEYSGRRTGTAEAIKPISPALVEIYNRGAYKTRTVRGQGYTPASWYYERGLTDQTIKRFKLGHDGSRFTIPVFGADGSLLNIRFRKDPAFCTDEDYADGKLIKKYSGMPGRNGTLLYPENLITQDHRDWISVVEGELDAVRLYQESIPAATTTNGAGNLLNILKLLSRYDRIKQIYLCTEQDRAGSAAEAEFMREATAQGLYVIRLYWPTSWGKDITEVYQNQHTFQEVISFSGYSFRFM